MLNRLSLNIRRFLAGWWLRSRFLTYQSPLLLLELFEKLEHPRSPIERAPQRIKLGDTVRALLMLIVSCRFKSL